MFLPIRLLILESVCRLPQCVPLLTLQAVFCWTYIKDLLSVDGSRNVIVLRGTARSRPRSLASPKTETASFIEHRQSKLRLKVALNTNVYFSALRRPLNAPFCI